MSISDVNKCKNSFITSILDHKKPVDDPNDTSNIFNNFLASVGKTSYQKGNPSSESQPTNYAESIDVSFTSQEIWTLMTV